MPTESCTSGGCGTRTGRAAPEWYDSGHFTDLSCGDTLARPDAEPTPGTVHRTTRGADIRRWIPLRVLVAGATGVVGRALVPLLTSVGHDVVALARTPGRRPPA
ncbi:NAD-dependent epimerase/dehydratase family protein [Streptomyces sp. NPDC058467]|uniref:NAD-dependent epimerase/dehydratase family protein n=1 Tax=Streptomyces sp. NPDC058467 TaxID=3346513 RepID=UPI0036554765